MNKIIIAVLLATCFIFTGCSNPPKQYGVSPSIKYMTYNTVDTKKALYSDADITISIDPTFAVLKQIIGFSLKIQNKTKLDILLDWNDSYFIKNGTANGRFMPEGTLFINKDDLKQPLLIMSNSSSSIEIFPTANARRSYSDYKAWDFEKMEDGEFGLYATIKVGKQTKKIKLTMEISKNLNTEYEH